jgi:hypothetical protein
MDFSRAPARSVVSTHSEVRCPGRHFLLHCTGRSFSTRRRHHVFGKLHYLFFFISCMQQQLGGADHCCVPVGWSAPPRAHAGFAMFGEKASLRALCFLVVLNFDPTRILQGPRTLRVFFYELYILIALCCYVYLVSYSTTGRVVRWHLAPVCFCPLHLPYICYETNRCL